MTLAAVKSDTLQKEALYYYDKLSWCVVPLHSVVDGKCTCSKGVECSSAGKHPRINWIEYQDKRPSRETVFNWWKKWPNSNIGLVTGKVSGVIVLDLDMPDGMSTIKNGGYELPPTVIAQTGSGGYHYFFITPGHECSNFAGRVGATILPNVDFRGDGGLIVLAPSVNANGAYVWKTRPDEQPLVEAPEWLSELITAQNPTSAVSGARVTAEDFQKKIHEGGRNTELARLVGYLLAKRLPQDMITELLFAHNEAKFVPPLPEDEVIAVIESISRTHQRNHQNSNRDFIINVEEGHLPTISGRAWEGVLAANDPPTLFRRGNSICRVIQQDDGRPTIHDLCQTSLRGELARKARWVEIKESGDDVRFVDKFPPIAVIQDMLADPKKPLPILQRIVEAPVFGSEGTLQTSPGYHEGSQSVYYANGLELKTVSKKPSPNEIDEAKKWLLEELLGEFPFASKSDQLHAVAAMMGPFVREMIVGPTPLHLIEAPSPGTGKSLLADALTIPATGRPASTLTEGGPEEEWRKKITAILITSPPFVLIDNVRQKIDSPALAAALTSTRWEDRLLGRSEIVSLPVQTTWLATGNNPSLTTEMARRIVRIRLDAKVARPWQGREFRHPNLRKWAMKYRNELVWSTLTLIQAWIAAGQPEGDYDLGQYESWAAVMGGIFDVIELPGFLQNLDELYEVADEETAQWEGFVSEWWASYSNQPVGIGQLFDIADDNDHLLTVRGFGNPQSQKTKLGRAVSQMHGRHLGNFIVEKFPRKGRGGTALYRLKQTKKEQEDNIIPWALDNWN